MAATAKSKPKTARARKGAATMKRSRSRAKTGGAKPSTLGKAATVIAGAADAVWSTFVPPIAPSDHSATGMLEKQHREVERLFTEALGTEDARTRRSTMNQIIEKLRLHTMLEETIFYPAVRDIDTEQAKDMVLEAYEE